VPAKFRFIAKCVLSLISQREYWHERSQTVRTERQVATLEVWGGGVIRHQQRRRRPRQSAGEAAGVKCRQRTKTLCLVCRHFNAHICSSANLTRISMVKIPNSNINFEVRKFEVRLTSIITAQKSVHVMYICCLLQFLSALEVFKNDMRYINSRFTYLLTYLLTCHHYNVGRIWSINTVDYNISACSISHWYMAQWNAMNERHDKHEVILTTWMPSRFSVTAANCSQKNWSQLPWHLTSPATHQHVYCSTVQHCAK